MGRKNSIDKDLAALDELIEEITTDAYGDDEQLWAFRQVIEDDVTLPADGFVIGEPVSVVEIDYGGNTRRGLTAKCRREDGSVHVVAASEVTFPERSVGGRYVAAYRRWLGLDPCPGEAKPPARRKRRHKAADGEQVVFRRGKTIFDFKGVLPSMGMTIDEIREKGIASGVGADE